MTTVCFVALAASAQIDFVATARLSALGANVAQTVDFVSTARALVTIVALVASVAQTVDFVSAARSVDSVSTAHCRAHGALVTIVAQTVAYVSAARSVDSASTAHNAAQTVALVATVAQTVALVATAQTAALVAFAQTVALEATAPTVAQIVVLWTTGHWHPANSAATVGKHPSILYRPWRSPLQRQKGGIIGWAIKNVP